MTQGQAIVRYLPDGRMPAVTNYGAAWAVQLEGARPSHAARRAALLEGLEVVEQLLPCVGCGRIVATDGLQDYHGHAIQAVQADRAVQDLADFLVTLGDTATPARVAYQPATVIPTCSACNGSKFRELPEVQERLTAAAVARLDRYATRLDLSGARQRTGAFTPGAPKGKVRG
jgi:hypothetical protein